MAKESENSEQIDWAENMVLVHKFKIETRVNATDTK